MLCDYSFLKIAAGREKTHVRINEFKGKHYVDIRKFYEDKSGELKPSNKGTDQVCWYQ